MNKIIILVYSFIHSFIHSNNKSWIYNVYLFNSRRRQTLEQAAPGMLAPLCSSAFIFSFCALLLLDLLLLPSYPACSPFLPRASPKWHKLCPPGQWVRDVLLPLALRSTGVQPDKANLGTPQISSWNTWDGLIPHINLLFSSRPNSASS